MKCTMSYPNYSWTFWSTVQMNPLYHRCRIVTCIHNNKKLWHPWDSLRHILPAKKISVLMKYIFLFHSSAFTFDLFLKILGGIRLRGIWAWMNLRFVIFCNFLKGILSPGVKSLSGMMDSLKYNIDCCVEFVFVIKMNNKLLI